MATRIQLEGLNEVLSLMYGTPTRIGPLLTTLGFDREQVAAIRDSYLGTFIPGVIDLLQQRLSTVNRDGRLYIVLCRRLSLDGAPVETLQSLGSEFGISRERVRQLQQKAVRILRTRAARRFVETGIVELATQLVDNPMSNCTDSLPETRDSTSTSTGIERMADPVSEDQPPMMSSVIETRNTFLQKYPEARRLYPRAYEAWTNVEDTNLALWIRSGEDIHTVATRLQRRPSAITSRLKRLGVYPLRRVEHTGVDAAANLPEPHGFSVEVGEGDGTYPLPWSPRDRGISKRQPWWITEDKHV